MDQANLARSGTLLYIALMSLYIGEKLTKMFKKYNNIFSQGDE